MQIYDFLDTFVNKDVIKIKIALNHRLNAMLTLPVFLFMTILPKSFFPLMGSHFMAFSFSSAGHFSSHG
jgi:hypothetical protein